MPQMDFYFTDHERKELFNFIQLKGGIFIPDLYFYCNDQYYVIADGDELLDYIKQKKVTHYFVIDKSFTTEPLILTQNSFMKEAAYSIKQRTGGPYIDFSFYLGHSNDARILHKASNIDIYSKFIHHDGHEEFRAPNELKKYYKDIVKYIESKCKILTLDNKKFRVGHAAFQVAQIL